MWNGTDLVPLWCYFRLSPGKSRALHEEHLEGFSDGPECNFLLNAGQSLLVGSVRTESSRMSPSSSDTGSYLTIKSSIILGAVNYLDLVQPKSFRGEFSFPWRGMISYFASCWSKRLFAQCWMRICVRWIRLCVCLRIFCTLDTAFANVVRILHTYTALLFTLLILL